MEFLRVANLIKKLKLLTVKRIIIASATRLERYVLLSKMSPYISMLGRVP